MGEEGPSVNEIIEQVVRQSMRPVDADDINLTWEMGFHAEGAVFDEVLKNLPNSKGRDLIEQVLALVDWERVVEKATWRIEGEDDTIL